MKCTMNLIFIKMYFDTLGGKLKTCYKMCRKCDDVTFLILWKKSYVVAIKAQVRSK